MANNWHKATRRLKMFLYAETSHLFPDYSDTNNQTDILIATVFGLLAQAPYSITLKS